MKGIDIHNQDAWSAPSKMTWSSKTSKHWNQAFERQIETVGSNWSHIYYLQEDEKIPVRNTGSQKVGWYIQSAKRTNKTKLPVSQESYIHQDFPSEEGINQNIPR